MNLLLTLIITISISLIDCTGTNFHGKYHLRYEQVKPRIEICYTDDRTYMKHVLVHELGHYFWFEYLNKEEKDNYRKLFNESLPSDFFLTNSMKDTEEDFADSFVFYYAEDFKITYKGKYNIYNKKDIISSSKKIEEKINFIGDLIKKYESGNY